MIQSGDELHKLKKKYSNLKYILKSIKNTSMKVSKEKHIE